MRTLGAGVAVLVAAGCGGEAIDPASARIERMRAVLVERAEASGSWSARWRLCWSPVAGARSYAVTVVTPEGAGRTALRAEASCWSLTVATGVPRRGELARQVALVAPSLSVRVAAVLAGGRTGPSSPAVPVGAAYQAVDTSSGAR